MRFFSPVFPLCLVLSTTGCTHVFKQDFNDDSGAPIRTETVAVHSAVEAQESFIFEAESGRVLARGADTWQEFPDEDASGAKMLRKVGGSFYGEAKQGPGIIWTHTASSTGMYDIWIRVKPNASGDSLFFEWAGDSLDHHWAANTLDKWGWAKLRSVEVLAEREYEFALWSREDKIEVDLVVLQSAGAAEPKIPN